MADVTDQLKRAYTLIKEGNKQAAVQMITPILKSDRNNAAAWWLMANAASKPEHVRQALEQVLRLKPDDERARTMLARIEKIAGGPSAGGSASMPAAAKPSAMRTPPAYDPFASLDDEVGEDDDLNLDDVDLDDIGDPFGDPFAGVGSKPTFAADRRSAYADQAFVGVSSGSYSAPRPAQRSASHSTNNNILVYSIAGIASIVFLGIIIFALTRSDTLSSGGRSRPNPSGRCEVAAGAGSGGQFSLQQIICSDIQYGQVWAGLINPYQQHEWAFNGVSGQEIVIEGTSLSESADLVLRLLAPNGEVISLVNDSASNNARIQTTLLAAGRHVLEVELYRRQSSGEYEVYLQVTGDEELVRDVRRSERIYCDGAVTSYTVMCGETFIGIDDGGQLDRSQSHRWTFSAQAGQTVVIYVDGSSTTDTTVEVVSPSGTQIAQNDDVDLIGGNLDSEVIVTFPSTGVYTIVVSTWDSMGGTYELRLRQ